MKLTAPKLFNTGVITKTPKNKKEYLNLLKYMSVF